jgi:hypothetical protein
MGYFRIFIFILSAASFTAHAGMWDAVKLGIDVTKTAPPQKTIKVRVLKENKKLPETKIEKPEVKKEPKTGPSRERHAVLKAKSTRNTEIIDRTTSAEIIPDEKEPFAVITIKKKMPTNTFPNRTVEKTVSFPTTMLSRAPKKIHTETTVVGDKYFMKVISDSHEEAFILDSDGRVMRRMSENFEKEGRQFSLSVLDLEAKKISFKNQSAFGDDIDLSKDLTSPIKVATFDEPDFTTIKVLTADEQVHVYDINGKGKVQKRLDGKNPRAANSFEKIKFKWAWQEESLTSPADLSDTSNSVGGMQFGKK